MAAEATNTPEQADYTDVYSGEDFQSLINSLDEREDYLQSIPMPEEDYGAIHEPVSKLKDNIRDFAEQENIYGPEPETWEQYLARQTAIEASMDAVYKAYYDDVPKDIKKSYLNDAVQSTQEANDFWQKEFAKLLEKDQRMEQEMTAMRTQMEELRKIAQEKNFTPEQLAQSMALAMMFLENAKTVKAAAHKEKHPATAHLFQNTRKAVHGCYQDIVGIPHRAATAIQNKAYQLADRAIKSITGVFDKGISFLAKRRQAIAQMSPLYEQKMTAVALLEAPKQEKATQKDIQEEQQEKENNPQQSATTEEAAPKEAVQEEKKSQLSPEVEKQLQEADEAMKELDYNKFLDNHRKFQVFAHDFNENKDGIWSKVSEDERIFFSSLIQNEGTIFQPTASDSPNYAKYEVLQKAERELVHVAKECLINDMLQADVVDLINKYAPSANILKDGVPIKKGRVDGMDTLGDRVVQEAMKDPQVQQVTQHASRTEQQR